MITKVEKPLWKLELEREAAVRRFNHAEETYRAAERELHRVNAEIDSRRAQRDTRIQPNQ